MLLKDETRHVYETVKFWKIIPQIYRHIYTHLKTNEKPFPKGHTERRNSLPFVLLFIFLVRQTDSLYYSTICSEERGKMLPQPWQTAH